MTNSNNARRATRITDFVTKIAQLQPVGGFKRTPDEQQLNGLIREARALTEVPAAPDKIRTSSDFLELDGAPFNESTPYGWLQHKGTNLCIDLHCVCGELTHFDGDFLYNWVCPACKRHYATGSHLAMHEMSADEIAAAKQEGRVFMEQERSRV